MRTLGVLLCGTSGISTLLGHAGGGAPAEEAVADSLFLSVATSLVGFPTIENRVSCIEGVLSLGL